MIVKYDPQNLNELMNDNFPYAVGSVSAIGHCFEYREIVDLEMMAKFGPFARADVNSDTIDLFCKWDFYWGEFRFKTAEDAIFFKLKYT